MSNIEDLRWLAEQGCHFALPAGRTKNKFEFDWPNKPHTLDEAIAHSIHGNVGILTGKHSGNIIAIDRDVNFPQTCAMLGQFAHTAKIVRDNAPERGKFLYRIKGEIPPTTSWKPPGVKHPEAELLADNGQRHALCPPSAIDDGCYILLDKELGIQELTPVELDYIWRLITGGSIYKETRVHEEQQIEKSNKDDFVRMVKDAWTTEDIFEHFNMATAGTEPARGETRILGNGGLLVSGDGNLWYNHSESMGGDKIDAWAYCRWGKPLDRTDKRQFIDVINEMAEVKGIKRPEKPSLAQWKVAEETESEKRNTWPYLVRDGMLIFQKEKITKHGSEIIDTEICAFTAKISEEIIMEDGRKIFVIEGIGKRGGPFKFEIDAELYGTTNKLCAALESAVGSKDPIFAEQHKHVGPAIKILTDNIQPVRRYVRTGWTPHGFVIPGKVIPGVDIQLDRKLAYEYDIKANLEKGKYALGRLIESIHPGNACIVLSVMFTAPLAQLIGWENERYGIFNKGITNSLKTSWTQAAMCIYGKGFINRDNLIKFGDGSTKTALMTYATKAGHMPYSLDNYKPNTGGGAKEFISMLHNIMEGGDRDRGKRDGGIRENHSITCWPIFTGEDMPDSDASSFARVLVVPFAWGKNELNKALGEAQALSEHLPAIGRTWLDYLSNEETKAIITKTKERYWATREAWIKYLADQHKDMSITLRIATSLTINQLAFEIVCQCFEMLTQYKETHIEALRSVAGGMAIHTTESAEYQRFLAALKELLATGRAIVIPRYKPFVSSDQDTRKPDPDRFIGWHDDEGFYILPVVARRLVMSVLDRDGLNGISNQQLYDQLQQADMMIPGAKQSTKQIKVAGENPRVIHLRLHALQGYSDTDSLYEEVGV